MKKTLLMKTLLMLLIIIACNAGKSSKPQFKLTGTINGIENGKVILSPASNPEAIPDTAIIINGKFEFTANIDYPELYTLRILEPKKANFAFYAENTHMTFSGQIDNLNESKFTGGSIQDNYYKLKEKSDAIVDKYNLSSLYKELNSDDTSKERKEEIRDIKDKVSEEIANVDIEFIKHNPTSYYSAILTEQNSYGKTVPEIEEMLSLLDPSLKKTPLIKGLLEKVERMKRTEIGIENIIKAEHVNYKVDKTFKGEKFTNIKYLARLSNNNICAFNDKGIIQIFNSRGDEVRSFSAQFDGTPSVIAVDKSDHIYVFGYRLENTKRTYRGRTYNSKKFVGVGCLIFTSEGTQINKFDLKDIRAVTGACIANNRIFIADNANRKIAIFNAKSGAKINEITGMRPCCGILDFSLNANSDILVANLGAFRVQCYDVNGKLLYAFGQRGRGIDDFHGCCNPVSVAYLSNGAIVTVEKDPTRIKIYSKEGARQIEGIQELVHGCRYIPMVVDGEDNLYLASAESGVVKCIPAS